MAQVDICLARNHFKDLQLRTSLHEWIMVQLWLIDVGVGKVYIIN
jgi:hypothetical protein